jgi:hypothetical protein
MIDLEGMSRSLAEETRFGPAVTGRATTHALRIVVLSLLLLTTTLPTRGEQAAATRLEPAVTRDAVCRRIDRAPAIDGKLDDRAWAGGLPITAFAAYWDRADRSNTTRAALAWDDDALYFAATLTDAELRAYGTRRNDRLWLGDVFELFFKPFDDRPEYYEFQVNPLSTILELAFPKRGFDFATLAAMPPWDSRPSPGSTARSTTRAIATGVGPSRGAFPGRSSRQRGDALSPVPSGALRSADMITAPRGPSPCS